jgi:hypothetical protein
MIEKSVIIKFLLILDFILCILLTGCMVNTNTGLITIENRTNTALQNVYVGNYLVSLYLAPGCKSEFYYYGTISGLLSTSGVNIDNSAYFDLNGNSLKDQGEGIGEVNFSFKTSYWVRIYGYYSSNAGKNMIGMSINKQDGTISGYRQYIDY